MATRIASITTIILSIIAFNVCNASSIHFPPSGLGSIHTYTIWDGIKWGGNCGYLINFAKNHNTLSDTYGIVKYGEYFAGATTTTFGNVGDMLLVVETDGYVYPVIIADTKNQNNYGCTVWGHQWGNCIVEFEILSCMRSHLYGTSGGYISDLLSKPIYKVINIGSVFDSTYYFENPKQACIDNGLTGYYLLNSPYGGYIVSED